MDPDVEILVLITLCCRVKKTEVGALLLKKLIEKMWEKLWGNCEY